MAIKQRGRAYSIPAGLGYSAMFSILSTLILSSVFACFLKRGTVPIEKAGYGVMFILFIVAYLTGILAEKLIKHQILYVICGSGVIYMGILLGITALFYGGQYTAVGETAVMILAGVAAAIMTAVWGKKRSGIHHQKR